MTPNLPAVATANNLRGFKTTSLRVIVREMRDGYAWVTTADLMSQGIVLVLDAGQIDFKGYEAENAAVHEVLAAREAMLALHRGNAAMVAL